MKERLEENREELILKNMRLVGYIAKKFNLDYYSTQELIAVGYIGLIKASKTFDFSKKIKFATYASICIRNEIAMYLRKENKQKPESYLDAPLNNEDIEGVCLKDLISDSNSDFTSQIETLQILERIIKISLNNFSGKERIILLYMIAGKTQKFIEERVCITQAYISRLEVKIKRKLREMFEMKDNDNKEIFKVDISDEYYNISFSSRNIKDFDKSLKTVLSNTSSEMYIPEFKVFYHEDRIFIVFFADLECFEFIARIIQELDSNNALKK